MAFNSELNIRIQLAAAFFVFIAAAIFGVSRLELVALIFAVALVIILELINTAMEYLLDLLKPRINRHVLLAKDVSAAAVAAASVASIFIGLIIFWPYFQNILN